MAYSLGAKSRAELEGVHPDLVRVVERAIVLSKQDFAVHDGLRTLAEQKEFVRRGVSRTMNSMHRIQSDGHGHAVDLVPWINGQLRWEWEPIYHIAAAMLQASLECGVRLRWGAVWDMKLASLCPAAAPPERYAAALKAAVAAYCARHPGPDFIDGPHFELA